jgi:hypothetical protein
MATGTLPITGMPATLTAAVNGYDDAARRTIITKWAMIGPDERARICEEIERSSRWMRRWRAEVAAARLSG